MSTWECVHPPFQIFKWVTVRAGRMFSSTGEWRCSFELHGGPCSSFLSICKDLCEYPFIVFHFRPEVGSNNQLFNAHNHKHRGGDLKVRCERWLLCKTLWSTCAPGVRLGLAPTTLLCEDLQRYLHESFQYPQHTTPQAWQDGDTVTIYVFTIHTASLKLCGTQGERRGVSRLPALKNFLALGVFAVSHAQNPKIPMKWLLQLCRTVSGASARLNASGRWLT